MIYATWSQGFRPGGINRVGSLPPYKADYLDNYEFGWKTEWLDHHLLWNGAVFQRKLEGLPVRHPRPERPDRNQQREPGAHPRPRNKPGLGRDVQPDLDAGICVVQVGADRRTTAASLDANDNPVTDCPAGTSTRKRRRRKRHASCPTHCPTEGQGQYHCALRFRFPRQWGSYFQAAGFFEGRRKRTDLRVVREQHHRRHARLRHGRSFGGDEEGLVVVRRLPEERLRQSRRDRSVIRNAQISACVQPAGTSCSNLPGQYYINPIQPRTIGFRVTRNFEIASAFSLRTAKARRFAGLS